MCNRKGVKLTVAMWCLSVAFAWAQSVPKPHVAQQNEEEDNSDFAFTESQLDEDLDASQAVSVIVSSNNDPYASEVGYLFSPMRFRVRAYDNMYNQTYMNGLLLNDLETGRFNYSMIGGMNDATRNQEGVSSYENNAFGMTGVGGANNINTRASQFASGSKLALSACNRNYKARAMYTYSTGMMSNGWAFAGTLGYRWADEGVIEGTYYNSFSYLLSAEKRINDHHNLSLVTFGSPTERGQQGASTEEAYWLANDHYYNPNWGYQNGKKRNSRVVNDFEPTAIMTWDWKLDENRRLSTAAGYKYSMYSSTALSWSGNAYDPRPDYYKNMPSSIFNVYNPETNNPDYFEQHPYLLDEYNTLLDYWSVKANRQVNWDRMYAVNRISEAAGGEALYYQERRHNDQRVFALSSTWNHYINTHHKYTAGVVLNSTKGMHYKTMADLLGAARFTDVDKFAARDYGPNSQEAQNDLRNPNRQIKVDDKFGYNYNIFVNKAKAWAQYQYSVGRFNFLAGGFAEGTMIEREGLMQNGRAPENSYGKSGAAKFMGGGGKASLIWSPIANHRISLSGGYESVAPLARNSFVAPRMQNNFVDNLSTEDILHGEATYNFRFGPVYGKISGYYSKFMNVVEQTAFYNDQQSSFTYLTMSNIEREHYGIEAALVYNITGNLALNFLGTVSEAKYINNPYAQVNYEGMDGSQIATLNKWKNPVTGKEMPLMVLADGMRVNGTPLTALSLGFDYNVNGWFFAANVNYYDRVHIGYSAYRRLSNVVGNYTQSGVTSEGIPTFDVTREELNLNGGVLFDEAGNCVATYAAEQEEFDGDFMVDFSIGRYIRLKGGKSLSINLSVQNALNNEDIRTGGYEQNRDDKYYGIDGSEGREKDYVFSKNNKYYYANALNAFLNIGFRF